MGRSSLLVLLMFLITASMAVAQVNRYMVFFKDKASSPFTISDPADFLSQRAITRRQQQGIAVTTLDLPVNASYVAGVHSTGAKAYFTTRWMNGVLVQCDQSLVPAITALPYVDRVEFVAPDERLQNAGRKKKNQRLKSPGAGDVTKLQLEQIGIDDMHNQGYHGEEMIVAIFDAGFQGVDLATPFQAAFAEGRVNLEVSQDFVANSNDVFQYDAHGTEVFSVIAAHQQGTFTGGAYAAKYQLYVTEDVSTEYRIEEYNWLFAAERADSAGVDVINSSLGYYDFDLESMNYPKSAMDGKTAVVTRAAQMLADRGVVVVCSAGNEGNNGWGIITAPADAADVLAVASVDIGGKRASSSSIGPSADKRIKPDIAALGVGTNVILPNGDTGNASGTSLASPLITSLVTGVWQKYPSLNNKEVMALIRNSGSLAKSPNNQLGYGIPDFNNVDTYFEHLQEKPFQVYPNAFVDTITIKPFSISMVSACSVELLTSTGQQLFSSRLTFNRENPSYTANLSAFASGVYILRFQWEGKTHTVKITKQ